jgi:magnesium chelatase family protein
MTFPAEFMLVATMNPCPCGYYGSLNRDCRCGPNNVQKYRQRRPAGTLWPFQGQL